MKKGAEQELRLDHALWCGKIHWEPSASMKEETLQQSSKKQSESASQRSPIFMCLSEGGLFQEPMWEPDSQLRGEFSTLNFGESPSVVVESRLSQILQVTVPRKYYLSSLACRGILNRAERRGKELPEMLRLALENQAAQNMKEEPEDQES